MRQLHFIPLLALVLAGCGGPPAPRSCPAVAPLAAEKPAPAAQGIPAGPLRETLSAAGIDPAALRCSTRISWGTTERPLARSLVGDLSRRWKVKLDEDEADESMHLALGYLIRLYFELVRPDNLGAAALTGRGYPDAAGTERPLLLFRSGLTMEKGGGPSHCFDSLVKAAGVRHVINLYAGEFPFHDLLDREKARAGELGASYFDLRDHRGLEYRDLVKKQAGYAANLKQAQANVAAIIREQILRPGGAAPKGNIYFHCAGGMHRSGMLFGVIQRCLNGASEQEVEATYRRHVRYRSEEEKGGYEPLNMRFIREFDCALIKQDGAAATPQGEKS